MWLYSSTKALTPLFSLYWELKLTGPGVRRIPPAGPLIVAMNHVSFLDPWFLNVMFPRTVRFLVNENWYYKSAFWTGFFRANGCVPVGAHPRETLRVMADVLRQDLVVGIFPEGAISDDGKIRRFRSGLSRLAAKTGAPVLPLGIRGSYTSIPRGKKWPRPCPVHVHVGSAYCFPGSPLGDAPPSRVESRDFLHRTFCEICELSGQPLPVSVEASS